MSRARRRQTASTRSFSRLPFERLGAVAVAAPPLGVRVGRAAARPPKDRAPSQSGTTRRSSPCPRRSCRTRSCNGRSSRASASARSHSRLARISSPQTKVMVRAGGGTALAAIADCSARASSSSVRAPAGVVVRARFLDVGHQHHALLGRRAPGDLGDQGAPRRPGPEPRLDRRPHGHRTRRAGAPSAAPPPCGWR